MNDDAQRLALISADSDDAVEPYFLHGGFCVVGLPHTRPQYEHQSWIRSIPGYSLTIRPGEMTIDNRSVAVGLPYGPVARLINIYLHSQATKTRSPMIDVGRSMHDWFRRLDMSVNGQNYSRVRDQLWRIARSSLTIKREDERSFQLQDARMISGLDALKDESGGWIRTIEIAPEFFEHLQRHATPIDPQAIAALKSSSLALDVYLYLANRLPKLKSPLRLTWYDLGNHFGGLDASRARAAISGEGEGEKEGVRSVNPRKGSQFGRDVRKALDKVASVYPDANVEHVDGGLRLYPSPPSVGRKLHVVAGGALAVKKKPTEKKDEKPIRSVRHPVLVRDLEARGFTGRLGFLDRLRRHARKNGLPEPDRTLADDPIALADTLVDMGLEAPG